ncbi:hypothetical protein SCA6_012595 [Theobroma cacao]
MNTLMDSLHACQSFDKHHLHFVLFQDIIKEWSMVFLAGKTLKRDVGLKCQKLDIEETADAPSKRCISSWKTTLIVEN